MVLEYSPTEALSVGERAQFLAQASARVRLGELTRRFVAGELSEARWARLMQAEIREAATTSFLVGYEVQSGRAISRLADLSGPAGRAATGYINSQLRYFANFRNDLLARAGFIEANIPGILSGRDISRAKMYGSATDGAFNKGKLSAVLDEGEDAAVWWRLRPAEHCISCIALADASPFRPNTLPTEPGAGDTECRCITTPASRVLTIRGHIPIADIRVGDLVWTHRNRWRPVVAVWRQRSLPQHRQAWLKQPSGEWVGCTSDHKWLVGDIGQGELLVYTVEHGEFMPLWGEQGCAGRAVQGVRQSNLGARAMGFQARGYSSGATRGRVEAQVSLQRPDIRELQEPKGRWASLDEILGRDETSLSLPLPMGVAAGEWADSEQQGHPSYQWRPNGRPTRESGANNLKRPRGAPPNPRAARGDVGRTRTKANRQTDMDLPAMQESFPGVPQRQKPAQVLLEGLLPRGTPLYDITVAEDHSFVVEGMVSKNSNCQCFLEFKKWIG